MLGRIAAICVVLMAATVPLTAGEMTPAKKAALEAAGELEGLTGDIARDLWDLSETALLEERSARKLMDVLAAEGFAVEAGVAGMPTAFVASWGEGHPIVGVLAEYDALPGVGNAAVPRREPREDGVTAGQGCGHNLFGAASVTGAIAAKRAMAALKLPGDDPPLRHPGRRDGGRQGLHGPGRALRRPGRGHRLAPGPGDRKPGTSPGGP